MISASKSTLTLNSLKTQIYKKSYKFAWEVLQKILQICLRSFVNFHPVDLKT